MRRLKTDDEEDFISTPFTRMPDLQKHFVGIEHKDRFFRPALRQMLVYEVRPAPFASLPSL